MCPETINPLTFEHYLRLFGANRQLADLSDIQAVGVGLFLALGIVQVAGSVGISNLRRKVDVYKNFVGPAKRGEQYEVAQSLVAEANRADMQVGAINRILILIVCATLSVALVYFAYSFFAAKLWVTPSEVALITGYYLGLPIVLFIAFSYILKRKIEPAASAIAAAYDALKNG